MSLTMGCTFQYTRQGFFKQDSIRMSYMQRSLVRGRTMGGWKEGREGGREGCVPKGNAPTPYYRAHKQYLFTTQYFGEGREIGLIPSPSPCMKI